MESHRMNLTNNLDQPMSDEFHLGCWAGQITMFDKNE